jgi:S-adenosylmethionine decarboxylase
MFGPHLVLEGYKCRRKDRLSSESSIHELLSNFPARLNMNIIMSPKTMTYSGGDIPEDSGVSGFVIIAESHIAIHTFPEKGFFTLDIFSCKPFEIKEAIEFICHHFETEHFEHQVFERGREFPRCESRSSDIVSTDRTRYVSGREFSLVR